MNFLKKYEEMYGGVYEPYIKEGYVYIYHKVNVFSNEMQEYTLLATRNIDLDIVCDRGIANLYEIMPSLNFLCLEEEKFGVKYSPIKNNMKPYAFGVPLRDLRSLQEIGTLNSYLKENINMWKHIEPLLLNDIKNLILSDKEMIALIEGGKMNLM